MCMCFFKSYLVVSILGSLTMVTSIPNIPLVPMSIQCFFRPFHNLSQICLYVLKYLKYPANGDSRTTLRIFSLSFYSKTKKIHPYGWWYIHHLVPIVMNLTTIDWQTKVFLENSTNKCGFRSIDTWDCDGERGYTHKYRRNTKITP